MKLGVTLSTFAMQEGPVVFRDGRIHENLPVIRELGYRGVDLFADRKSAREIEKLRMLFERHQVEVAMYIAIYLSQNGVNLSCPDENLRQANLRDCKEELDKASLLGARLMPVGYLRGAKQTRDTLDDYYNRLADSLHALCAYADKLDITLCLEPINRYEINTLNSVHTCLEFITAHRLERLGLLLDTFHMNIEDASIEKAILQAGSCIKHFHTPDSNRQAAGDGHLDYLSVLASLERVNYDGYLTLEAFPIPDTLTCARKNAAYLAGCMAQSKSTTGGTAGL